MLLAQSGLNTPPEWLHNRKIIDSDGKTVAMYYAEAGLIPPSEWHHKPDLTDKNKVNVPMILASKRIKDIPKEWRYFITSQSNLDGNTVAMIFASNGIEPPKEWKHRPKLSNNNK